MPSVIREALARGERFLDELADLPVLDVPDPELIRSHLAGTYGFEEPVEVSELVADVARMLETWAVQTVHPRYFGYFNPTPVPEAVAGDLLTAVYNPQLAVWSHAPAAVEIEQHVLRWLTRKLGLPTDTSGAHFTSGGSEANFTAVVAALTSRLADYGRKGLAGVNARPTIYQSAGAHDSFTKICHMTGLGRDALRVVPVRGDLRMDPSFLRERMASDRVAGFTPVLVAGTAGTTAAGVIDPLEEISEVCRDFGAWFHVDAAWGGAAALCPRLREHLRGIERADSVTCDAHKWLNVTMGAGMLFCRDASVLQEAFRVSTHYMPAIAQGSVDLFVTSAQWSRRFIGLKLFMALASLGERGYAEMLERQAEVGEHMERRLEEAGWTHVSRTPLPVCCVTHPRIEAGEVSIGQVLDSVLESGRVWISKVTLADRPALRACVTSRLTTSDDIDTLVAEMNAAVGAEHH
jgi:glutamate/tyrosine decarboxylase-like PLP-dependent enzyme